MNKRIFPILIIFVFVSQFVICQNLISGNVIRENKKPFEGVRVTVDGVPDKVETTDQSGNFDIEVPLTAKILVFSYEGMKTQKIGIGKKSFISVTMIEGKDEVPKPVVKKEEKPKENAKKDTNKGPKKEVAKKNEINKQKVTAPKTVTPKEAKTKENTKTKEKPKTPQLTKEKKSTTDTTQVKEKKTSKPAKTPKVQTNSKSSKKSK